MAGHDHSRCLALFERLSEYIDGELDPVSKEEIETHMRDCIRCEVCLEILKRTRDLCRYPDLEPIPENLSRRLADPAFFVR